MIINKIAVLETRRGTDLISEYLLRAPVLVAKRRARKARTGLKKGTSTKKRSRRFLRTNVALEDARYS